MPSKVTGSSRFRALLSSRNGSVMSLRPSSLAVVVGLALPLLSTPLTTAQADPAPSASRVARSGGSPSDPDYGADIAARDGEEDVLGLDGVSYPRAPTVV